MHHDKSSQFLSRVKLNTEIADIFFASIEGVSEGSRISDFKIVRKIGGGAFGVVYLAEQTSLSRTVALKITPNLGVEGQTMAKLAHEHIVPVFSEEILSDPNIRIICMPVIEGLNLAELIEKLATLDALSGKAIIDALQEKTIVSVTPTISGLRFQDLLEKCSFEKACLHIVRLLLDALTFAHERGVLHLDIKPSNILLDSFGRPKLADFNISSGEDGRIIGGTQGYMSPEHERAFANAGEVTVDIRSDIYSVGRVLQELLNCQKNSPLHPILKGLVDSCLDEDPEQRPQTSRNLWKAVDNALEILTLDSVQHHPPKILSWIQNLGAWKISLLVLMPQILGSVTNISYNYFVIVSELNEFQIAAFKALLTPYNLIVYPVCIGWLFYRFWQTSRILTEDLFKLQGVDKLNNCRHKSLALMKDVFWAVSIGWLPGVLVFPVFISAISESVKSDVYFKFAFSFVSSWLVAFPFSVFFTAYYVLGKAYPKAWSAFTPLQSAKRELDTLPRKLDWYLLAAGCVPLLGAVMSLGWSGRGYVYEVIIALLIAIGMASFVLGINLVNHLKSLCKDYLQENNGDGRS